VQHWIDEAYERFRDDREGAVSRVNPVLERMPPDLFGICVAATSGRIYSAGDADFEFTIMSVSKPFAFALAFMQEVPVRREVYASAMATNVRNQAIARLLALDRDPGEAVDLYTRQCSLRVSARDLAVMGATLADGGVNPLTGERVVDAEVCHYTLAVMLTAGLYEDSGEWLYDAGLPAKSGIGGGIVTVSPGKGGLGTFAPRLDAAGNSVKGGLVARALSRRLGLDLLISKPLIPPG
jgi:glutaminase